MAFGSSSVLGIELGSKQIRLIQGAAVGELLRVFDFASEDTLIADPENRAQQLESLLERKRLRSLPAALTLSGPGVVHRVLDFPPMPLNELAVVVEREMHVAGGVSGQDVVFDWELLEENGSGSLKQIRVLVAIAPRPQVDGAVQMLTHCGLKPALLTTAPIALLRSLRFVVGGERGLQAVLYLGGEQGHLLGVKDGIWSFYREFSSRSGEKAVDALLEEAVREANRALLYQRQRYREGGEMGLLLSGEQALAEVQIRLERETGVRGEIAHPGPAMDLVPLRERANIFRDLFPAFLIPLGLVAAAHLPAGINLVPKGARKTVRSRPSVDLSFIRRPGLALALLLVFLSVHLVFVFTERYYRGLLAERTALYNQWAPAIQASEESRVLRENEKLLAQAVGRTRGSGISWVVLFKAVGRLAPTDLLLSSMTVQRDKDKGAWLVTLKGQVLSPDSYAAQTAFNRFYQGLKGSPHFERIELLPLNISTVTEKLERQPPREAAGAPGQSSVQNQQGGVEIKKTRVQFELRAQSRGV